jgi:murein DD-endopeptidase MepM/ murein hydrolase activator NlpD
MNRLILALLLIFVISNAIFINLYMKERAKAAQYRLQMQMYSEYVDYLSQGMHQELGVEVSQTRDSDLEKLFENYLSESEKADTFSGEELYENLSSREQKERFLPDLMPIKGDYAVSQKFSKAHPGIDLAAPMGTEVVAAASGEVTEVFEDKYFGKVLKIDHFNGYTTMYAHLAVSLVSTRELVEKGQVIALVGSTGTSTAPHLHFEIHKEDEKVDPMLYLK